MENNPSTSQGMHKKEARQWKTQCCVPQCNNNSARNPELSFHKIPKNKNIKKKWVRALKQRLAQSSSKPEGMLGTFSSWKETL